jgi:hypothetical protein
VNNSGASKAMAAASQTIFFKILSFNRFIVGRLTFLNFHFVGCPWFDYRRSDLTKMKDEKCQTTNDKWVLLLRAANPPIFAPP